MARKIKTNDNKRISFYSVNFKIKRSDRTGTVQFGCEIFDSKAVSLAEGKITAPLLTAWVDEDRMDMIKCHFLLPITSKNRTQAKLARHILEVLVKGGPQQFGKRELDITANTDGLCIMAVKPGQMYSEYDKIDYRRYKVADNKAMAMQYLIEEMRSYVTVGGTKLIDFSILDEDILLEIGFEKIADQVGKGLPMWKCYDMMDEIRRMQTGAYSNRHKEIMDTCNQILDIVSKSLREAA